jgi:hypothetical protein
VAKHEKTCARAVVFKTHARAVADSRALKKLKSMKTMMKESESKPSSRQDTASLPFHCTASSAKRLAASTAALQANTRLKKFVCADGLVVEEGASKATWVVGSATAGDAQKELKVQALVQELWTVELTRRIHEAEMLLRAEAETDERRRAEAEADAMLEIYGPPQIASAARIEPSNTSNRAHRAPQLFLLKTVALPRLKRDWLLSFSLVARNFCTPAPTVPRHAWRQAPDFHSPFRQRMIIPESSMFETAPVSRHAWQQASSTCPSNSA